ncbi:MAG: carboxyltransferase domain-containing protein, partial [Mycobacterium sp.]
MRYPIHDYGDRALLIECGCTNEVLALAETLRQLRPAEVTDVVPGARTVLVHLREPSDQYSVRTWLAGLAVSPGACVPDTGHEVVIDVAYDGADLAEVARHAGMAVDDVIAAHTGT